MGKTYTIDRNAFTWPAYDIALAHPDPSVAARQSGHALYFDEFGNAELKLNLSNDVWWFNGEDASYYEEQGTLGPTISFPDGNFVWEIVSGTDVVHFAKNGEDKGHYHFGPDVRSIDVASTEAGPFTVKFTYSNPHGVYIEFEQEFLIYTPARLERMRGNPVDTPGLNNRYETFYYFRVWDNAPKPRIVPNLEMNEELGGWIPAAGSWGNPSLTGPGNTVANGTFHDHYEIPILGVLGLPKPVPYGTGGWDTLVMWRLQSYYAGSTESGKGVHMKTINCGSCVVLPDSYRSDDHAYPSYARNWIT